MHRSGTSAVSGGLQKLGIGLGERLVAPGQDNPKGYFENEGIVNIHSELFHDLGSWWYDPRPLPGNWMESQAGRRAENALIALIRGEFANSPIWAVKDPRMCRFLPLWRKILDRLAIRYCGLMVIRDPREVAASLAARNGFRATLGKLLWLRHVMDTLADSAGMEIRVVQYDELLADPGGAIGRALGRMDLSIPIELEQGYEALSNFIDPGMRHHSFTGEEDESSLSSLSARVYLELIAWSRGEDPGNRLNSLQAEFERIWEQVGPYVDAMADAVFPEFEKVRKQSQELYALKSDLNAQVQWAEQTVAQHREIMDQRNQVLAEVCKQRDQLEVALTHSRSDLIAQIRWAEETLVQHREIVQALGDAVQHERQKVDDIHAREQKIRSDANQLLDQCNKVIELLRDELRREYGKAESACAREQKMRVESEKSQQKHIQAIDAMINEIQTQIAEECHQLSQLTDRIEDMARQKDASSKSGKFGSRVYWQLRTMLARGREGVNHQT